MMKSQIWPFPKKNKIFGYATAASIHMVFYCIHDYFVLIATIFFLHIIKYSQQSNHIFSFINHSNHDLWLLNLYIVFNFNIKQIDCFITVSCDVLYY